METSRRSVGRLEGQSEVGGQSQYSAPPDGEADVLGQYMVTVFHLMDNLGQAGETSRRSVGGRRTGLSTVSVHTT